MSRSSPRRLWAGHFNGGGTQEDGSRGHVRPPPISRRWQHPQDVRARPPGEMWKPTPRSLEEPPSRAPPAAVEGRVAPWAIGTRFSHPPPAHGAGDRSVSEQTPSHKFLDGSFKKRNCFRPFLFSLKIMFVLLSFSFLRFFCLQKRGW